MNILEFFYVLDEMVSLVCFVTASARFAQLKQQGAKSVNGPSFVCYLYS
jgi:hypothetical protein